jgi:hypothetical protein
MIWYNFVVLCDPLCPLCTFVEQTLGSLCAFVIILCDIHKFNLIGSYSLIPHLPCYYHLHIIYFLHLLSTNHKCTQPCYFPLPLKPATQKLKKIWNTLIWCSRRAITPGQFPVELWCLSTTMLPRAFDLVFYKDIIQ